MRAVLFASVVLLAAPAAWAQDEVPADTRPERLYVNPGVLMGSSRVVALGGAYVGVAEGVAGFTNNLAALAHRTPYLDKDWDVGVTLSWLDLPLSKAKGKDLDNDGFADDAPETLQLLGAVMLQYRNFGLGFSVRNQQVGYCNTLHCDQSDLLRVSLIQTALAGAVALGRDEFILGFGIYSAQAVFNHKAEGDWRHGDTGLALDVLYRPLGRPYRLGVSVRAVGLALVFALMLHRRLRGRSFFRASIFLPAVLSLGVSWRLGEGAENYNRLSPAARRQMLEGEHFSEVPPEDMAGAPTGRWLISVQADFISPVENAVSVRSFTALTEPTKVGASGMVQPRVGVEHETWPGRLRTRLGTFIEPSPFEKHLPRPHVTGGFELFLFRYWEDWALTASFDASRRYSNFGISVGFWR